MQLWHFDFEYLLISCAAIFNKSQVCWVHITVGKCRSAGGLLRVCQLHVGQIYFPNKWRLPHTFFVIPVWMHSFWYLVSLEENCSIPQRHYEKTSESNWKRNTKHKKVWFGQSLLGVNWRNKCLESAHVSQQITPWNTFLSSSEMPRKAPPHHSLMLGPIEKSVLIM